MRTSLPMATLAQLQAGVLALLSRRTSRLLAGATSGADWWVLTLACLVLAHRLPEVVLVRRLSPHMAQVLASIAVNTWLSRLARPDAPGETAVALLAAYLLSAAVEQQSASGPARYLLALNLSMALEAYRSAGAALAWLAVLAPRVLRAGDELLGLGALVAVNQLTGWVRAPDLPGVLGAVYLFAPFVAEFPALAPVFDFAVLSLTDGLQAEHVPVWALAVALWAVWRLEPDPTSRRLARAAGAHVAVVLGLGALQAQARTDPVLVALLLLLGMGVLGV